MWKEPAATVSARRLRLQADDLESHYVKVNHAPGSHLKFLDHNGMIRTARVITPGHGGRLKVKNIETGKDRWIDASRIRVDT